MSLFIKRKLFKSLIDKSNVDSLICFNKQLDNNVGITILFIFTQTDSWRRYAGQVSTLPTFEFKTIIIYELFHF